MLKKRLNERDRLSEIEDREQKKTRLEKELDQQKKKEEKKKKGLNRWKLILEEKQRTNRED